MTLIQKTAHLVTILGISATVLYASADRASDPTRCCPKDKQVQCTMKQCPHDSTKSCKKDVGTCKQMQSTCQKNQGEAKQATCPVMGGKINKDIFADYNGKRVYFCCPMCIETFKNDPEKYLSEMKKSGQSIENAPDVQ